MERSVHAAYTDWFLPPRVACWSTETLKKEGYQYRERRRNKVTRGLASWHVGAHLHNIILTRNKTRNHSMQHLVFLKSVCMVVRYLEQKSSRSKTVFPQALINCSHHIKQLKIFHCPSWVGAEAFLLITYNQFKEWVFGLHQLFTNPIH